MNRRRLERWRRLGRAERRVLVRAWALLVLLNVAVRVLALPRLLALGRRTSSRRAPAAEPSATRVAELVEIAGRYAPGTTCLTMAVAAALLLRRHGVETMVHIGVSRDAIALAAHAWLEVDGRVVLGDVGRADYTPIFAGSVGG